MASRRGCGATGVVGTAAGATTESALSTEVSLSAAIIESARLRTVGTLRSRAAARATVSSVVTRRSSRALSQLTRLWVTWLASVEAPDAESNSAAMVTESEEPDAALAEEGEPFVTVISLRNASSWGCVGFCVPSVRSTLPSTGALVATVT